MVHGNGQTESPSALQTDKGRDDRGRFAPGNQIGKPFVPGQSGNPSGRPEGVSYPGDWMRGLCGCTRAELQQVIDDERAPASKIAAAMSIMDMMDKDPDIRRRASAAVMDRTEGKASVQLNVSNTGVTQRSGDIEDKLVSLLRDNPSLMSKVAHLLPGRAAVLGGGDDPGQG